MANLLAYRALGLFPAAPARSVLAVTGWVQAEESEPFFTWPLWTDPADPDSVRSLLLLPELYLPMLDFEGRVALRARRVGAAFRSRRIKVGTGTNLKINFSAARAIC